MSSNLKRLSLFVMVTMLLSMILLVACGEKENPIFVPAPAQAGDLVNKENCTYKANNVATGD